MGPEGLMRSSFCITSKHFREPFSDMFLLGDYESEKEEGFEGF